MNLLQKREWKNKENHYKSVGKNRIMLLCLFRVFYEEDNYRDIETNREGSRL